MKKTYVLVVLGTFAILSSCGTTSSAGMYDPNEPVPDLVISTFSSIDPSDRSIVLPAGGEELVFAFKEAFAADGWAIAVVNSNARYLMLLKTKEWRGGGIAYINLSIVDQKNGTEVLTAIRESYTTFDKPVNVQSTARTLVDHLRKITSPVPAKSTPPNS